MNKMATLREGMSICRKLIKAQEILRRFNGSVSCSQPGLLNNQMSRRNRVIPHKCRSIDSSVIFQHQSVRCLKRTPNPSPVVYASNTPASSLGKSDLCREDTSSRVCVKELLHQTEKVLTKEGITEAQSSAQHIIAYVLGRKTLHGVNMEMVVSQEDSKHVQELVRLRCQSMPVQYVIKEWDFRGLTLDLKQPVFIPRPETEELVEHILAGGASKGKFHFLEVGPGSGAICLSILKANPEAHCVAVERSMEACGLTRHNADKLGVSSRLKVINSPLNQVEVSVLGRSFDCLVSNPPYIKTEDMERLQAEIIRYEDHGALHGGHDGLDVVRDILKVAPQILHPGASVWLEVDSSHPDLISEMVRATYPGLLVYKETVRDFNGLARFCHLQLR